MADISINKRQLAQVEKRLKSFGPSMIPLLKEAVDDTSELVKNHARTNHFFVGTGKGSSAKAELAELKFTNPNGSLRFMVRTGNLIASIQSKASRVIRGVVSGEVVAGMEYAQRVEEGGPGSRGAKPFMKPAAEANRPKFFNVIRLKIAQAIRRQRGRSF